MRQSSDIRLLDRPVTHNFFFMPFLRLRDERTGEVHEFDRSEVRIGRDPDLELVIQGEGRKVVSGHHAQFVYRDGSWWIEDLSSRNGTFLNDGRVTPAAGLRVRVNSIVRLGTSGPVFLVQVVTSSHLSGTLIEGDLPSASPSDATVPMDSVDLPSDVPASSPQPRLSVLYEATGERQEVWGARIRMGRGRDCEMRPVGIGDTSVSRMHAEIEFRADGGVVIRDLGSRNGTLLNGSAIEDECPLRLGDRVKLGASGPEFLIELLEGGHAPAAAVAGDDRAQQVRESDPRRSYGGKGATVFFQDLIEESSRKTHARTRWVVWTSVVLLAGAMGVMYWVSEVRVRETGRMLAEQRATADSLQREAEAEYVRLRGEFDAARASAAPTAVLDSLRQALTEAGERTDALEAALQRAQVDLNRQLSVGDSMQRAAQQELARVRTSGDRTTGLAAPCSQASRGAGCRHRNRLAGGARLRPVDCSSGQFGCRRIGHCCVWRRSLRGFWIRADIVWLFCH